MGSYLCYDIRGIQSFIFRIPKLKYIIGGSALIDQFDRDTAPGLVVDGTKHLYSGGGKGAYRCTDEDAAPKLRKKLIEAAHEIGLDIRFGISKDFTNASLNAVELYPFVPQPLEGEPCPRSGLYPVKHGDEEHPVVLKRIFNENEPMFRRFEDRLGAADIKLPRVDNPKRQMFFRNVNPRDPDDNQNGSLGAKALGNRNRWAVICMDGNDMGSQFRAMIKRNTSEDEMTEWVKAMSRALDKCTEEATKAGIQRVVSEWAATSDFDPKQGDGPVVLPIRPIVVGGDDIKILCHVAHAMTFVKEAIRMFRDKSIEWQKKERIELWPATGGQISISAGVLYCPVTLPLHTAVDYAESLLASAKTEGRCNRTENSTEAPPESIDWEQITDSIVDNPTARRQRELIFTDEDNGDVEVSLTARPYTLGRFEEIEQLSEKYKKLPVSVCHSVLTGLRQGYSDRLAFVAEIAKHQNELAGDIAERDFKIGKREPRWKYSEDGKSQVTDVVDAILLLEEGHRMRKETING